METWDAIRSRRNVRTYKNQPIGPDDLNRILDAARRTPSSSNKQRWDFVVCTDRAQLKELAQGWQSAQHVTRSAATIALIAPRPANERSNSSIQYDLGQATMSIMIAAADLGIGSAHASVRDQATARRVLGLPEDRVCAWLVVLGYPDDRPLTPIKRPDRRALEDVVHLDHW